MTGLVETRRLVLLDLQRVKLRAVMARDLATAEWLDGVILRQRDRLKYAERLAVKRAGFFTPDNAQFATSENRPDNQAGPGAVDD